MSLEAKEFLDNKQEEHFKQFGVYADVNSKLAEWMQEYKNKQNIMKVQISQRYVYHRVGTIEIEIDKDKYQDWIKENNYDIEDLDYYLSMNEDLWEEQIDEATLSSELEFGFGLGYCANEHYNIIFNEQDSESETCYDCKELRIGGHL